MRRKDAQCNTKGYFKRLKTIEELERNTQKKKKQGSGRQINGLHLAKLKSVSLLLFSSLSHFVDSVIRNAQKSSMPSVNSYIRKKCRYLCQNSSHICKQLWILS